MLARHGPHFVFAAQAVTTPTLCFVPATREPLLARRLHPRSFNLAFLVLKAMDEGSYRGSCLYFAQRFQVLLQHFSVGAILSASSAVARRAPSALRRERKEPASSAAAPVAHIFADKKKHLPVPSQPSMTKSQRKREGTTAIDTARPGRTKKDRSSP